MCVDIRYNLNMHKRFLDSIPDITNSVSQNLNILKISIKKNMKYIGQLLQQIFT